MLWDGVVCLGSNFALYSKGSSLLTFVMSSTTKLVDASNLSKTKTQISLWTIKSEIDKNIQHTSSVGCDIVFFLQELAASSWYAFWATLGSVPCPDLQSRGFAHHGGGANGFCVCHWQDCIHWPLCEGDLRWPTGTQIYVQMLFVVWVLVQKHCWNKFSCISTCVPNFGFFYCHTCKKNTNRMFTAL